MAGQDKISKKAMKSTHVVGFGCMIIFSTLAFTSIVGFTTYNSSLNSCGSARVEEQPSSPTIGRDSNSKTKITFKIEDPLKEEREKFETIPECKEFIQNNIARYALHGFLIAGLPVFIISLLGAFFAYWFIRAHLPEEILKD